MSQEDRQRRRAERESRESYERQRAMMQMRAKYARSPIAEAVAGINAQLKSGHIRFG